MSGPNASLMVPGLRRNMVTICAMTAVSGLEDQQAVGRDLSQT